MSENPQIRVPLMRRDGRLQQLPPVVLPPIRDLPDADISFSEADAEPFESSSLENAPDVDRIREQAQDAALRDERVRRHLANSRYEMIGVSLREDKHANRMTPIVVIYVYDSATTLEVAMDVDKDLEVVAVEITDRQPAPTDAEIERAIGIAAGDPRVAASLADDFDAVAILASAVDPGDLHFGRRCFAVGFGPADERLPRVRTVVDLSTDRVLAFSNEGAGS